MTGAMKKSNPHVVFHAGRFLTQLLDGSGHDMEWLAGQIRVGIGELEALLCQPNMDAELFVRLGLPFGPVFFDKLDRLILHGNHPDEVSKA